MKARAVHKAGRMNKLEAAYAQHLQAQVLTGHLRAWFFEAVKLKLADGLACTYTPDFMAIRDDGVVEFHEVKGHWVDDARVKIKCAADKYPFVFCAVTRKGHAWHVESFTDEATEGPTWAEPPFLAEECQTQDKSPDKAKRRAKKQKICPTA